MIPILYDANVTQFNNFGIGHLPDAISPHVVEERNGEFTFEMQYPIDGEHYSEIQLRSIICAKPSPEQSKQPFRVYRISKPINGIVTVSARNVRYDLEGIPVLPFTASGIAQALQAIKQNSLITNPFTFTTDKTNTQTMTLEAPAPALSLLGGVRGSLLDLYGGEYKFNGFTVNLLGTRGTDKGVVIRYGVDLIDLQQEENCAEVYTGVLCFWKSTADSTLVTGEIQNSGTFDYTRVKVVDKSTDYENAPTVARLNQDAVDYINHNKVGVPKVALNMRFANLEQTEEYSHIRQSLELCDQVTVQFEKLGVSAMAKVIRTDFDVINERYISVDIGDHRTSLADSVVSIQAKAESAPTTTEMQQAINATTAAITGANGGAVRLLDTNDDDLPDTLYIADNPSPLLASKVWRFNYEGWGASEHGYAGPFTMGATFQAGFIADFITAGTLNADRIGANSITVSKLTGKINGGLSNSWEIDLTNGSMTIGNLSANNITAGTLNVDRIASNSVGLNKLSGSISNNNWTIDLTNGTLTIGNISANNINAGTLSADRIGANSIAVSKLTGSIVNGQWKIDLDNGTMNIGNLSAANITSGTLNVDRIASNSVGIGKLSGSISNNNWKIDLTNGTLTIGNISANNINAGTLNVDRIASNSVGVGKLSGSISNGDWKIDLTNGTLTIGTISANKITSGTIDASQITVTNLNADNITTGSINGSRIEDLTIAGGKLQNGAVTNTKLGDYSISNSKLQDSTIQGTKIAPYTIKGGRNGNIDDLTITGSNIANTTLPGDKLEYNTLTDYQISGNSLSTASLDTNVNRSLTKANFADDVFNNRDTAPYCHASNMECDRLFETRFLSVNGTQAAWVAKSLVTWVGQEQAWAYAQTDQGSGMYKAFLLYQGTNVLSSSETVGFLG